MFAFDPDSHTYTLDGHAIPGVTRVIRPISPDFSMVPPGVLEAKRLLGTAVHEATSLDDDGELDDAGTDPVVMAYVTAWRAFRRDTNAVIHCNEMQLHSPTMRFAGTLDRIATIQFGKRAAEYLLDIKTSANPSPSYGVQLAGYDLLFGELVRAEPLPELSGKPLKRATVHLRDDGTYRVHTFENPADEACFRALLAVHHWEETTK
jgi:hypothetical protein